MTLSQNPAEHKTFFAHLRKQRGKHVNALATDIHEEVFAQTDCLTCANCCKTISPVFKDKDIERIAKSLKVKNTDFVQTYLRLDEDGDYVLQQTPCPFLGQDNYCGIYAVRPKACQSYPHTDKEFQKRLSLTLKNTAICPAAHQIVERMKERLPTWKP